MNTTELFILAVGLSMDAFAVAICKGLSLGKASFKNSCIVGLWFGGFQALMPTMGYLLGVNFTHMIQSFDHWIAFGLLLIIGFNMIRESREKDCCENKNASLSFRTMLLLAIATSIDALAVGVTFAFLEVNILQAASFIGLVTFACSFAGVKVGAVFGAKYKSAAELTGGAILILIGIKILLEHLNIISF